jgi:hypothetical protein
MLASSDVRLLAFGLVPLLLACSGTNTGNNGETTPTVDLPPASGAAIGSLRLAGSNGERWYVDGSSDDASADLVSVPGHNAFWFAWSVFHPGTDVWEGEPIAEATIAEDPSGQCTVPCENIFSACPGRDCIPPLDSPAMVPVGDAALSYLSEDDIVLGVLTANGPRAYPHNILWWHEVVNEEVGGDAFTVTLCPLTGSGLLFDRRGFVSGQTVRLGVSGLLYNSNLIMWDRETQSLWSQMRLQSLSGPQIRTASPLLPVFEMTWHAWRTLHPDTLAISSDTGFPRDYQRYPYMQGGVDYRTNDDDTFAATEPRPDAQFENKDMVFGVTANGSFKAYVWKRLEERVGSEAGVIADEVGGTPIAVVFHLPSRYVHAFERNVNGGLIELELETE